MKKIRVIFMFLLIFLMCSYAANAIRISPDFIRIEFEPNFEKSYELHTEAAENVEITIEGELAKYVSVEKNNIAKDGTFVINVKFPAEIETPGKNSLYSGSEKTLISSVNIEYKKENSNSSIPAYFMTSCLSLNNS